LRKGVPQTNLISCQRKRMCFCGAHCTDTE